MTTINDLLNDCITVQGHLIVTRWDEEDEQDTLVYDGDAEYIDDVDDDAFMDEDINFIYPDPKKPDTLHIELQW
jgi:hypothetical protein